MANLYSNELKAIMVAGNFQDAPKAVLKDRCLTVQHLDYKTEYTLNEANVVHDYAEPVFLNVTVRMDGAKHALIFYKRLIDNAYHDFSFLFNATFDANQRLDQYEDGLVVSAYVISVEQIFNSSSQSQEERQVELNVQMLVRSMEYMAIEARNNLRNDYIK